MLVLQPTTSVWMRSSPPRRSEQLDTMCVSAPLLVYSGGWPRQSLGLWQQSGSSPCRDMLQRDGLVSDRTSVQRMHMMV